MALSPIELRSNEAELETIELIILSANGEEISFELSTEEISNALPESFIVDALWRYHWINDRIIYTNVIARNLDLSSEILFTVIPVLIDPFSETWYPDYFSDLEVSNFSGLDVSPMFDRALFFDETDRLVLWDLENGHQLWEKIETKPTSRELNIWSPDGEYAFVSNSRRDKPELNYSMLISRNGEQIIELGNDTYPFPDGIVKIASWSPNSELLALASTDETIYIFDRVNNQYLYQCPVSAEGFLYPDQIVWGPDNRFIALGDDYGPLQILEIETGIRYEILDQGVPVGWTNAFSIEN